MKFRIEERKARYFEDLWQQMALVLGRPVTERERMLVLRCDLTARNGFREFEIPLDPPLDIGINLATMREYNLCGGSKSDTEYAAPTPPSSSPPTTDESTSEAPTPSDLFTSMTTSSGVRCISNVPGGTFVLPSSGSISTGPSWNFASSWTDYDSVTMDTESGTPAAEAATSRSPSRR